MATRVPSSHRAELPSKIKARKFISGKSGQPPSLLFFVERVAELKRQVETIFDGSSHPRMLFAL